MSAKDNYEFRSAAIDGDAISVKKLLDDPYVVSHITACDNEAFRFAAKYGYLEIVKILLAYPAVIADVSIRDNEGIIWAAENGNFEVVKCILEHINRHEHPDLFQTIIKAATKAAATFNYADMLVFILKESNYSHAFEALLFAAIHGHLPLSHLLLDFHEVQLIAHNEDNKILKRRL